MSQKSAWRSLYLCHLCRPSGEHSIYRAINRTGPGVLLEIGIGVGTRAKRMLEIASWRRPAKELEYIGIDPFESRGEAEGPGMTLKTAYTELRATEAKIRLIPGTAASALWHVATSLGAVDFVVVSAEIDLAALAEACVRYPKLLSAEPEIFLNRGESPRSPDFRRVPLSELQALAGNRSAQAGRAA